MVKQATQLWDILYYNEVMWTRCPVREVIMHLEEITNPERYWVRPSVEEMNGATFLKKFREDK